MSERSERERDDDMFRAVCKEAHDLLGKVTGPVRRVSVQAGEHSVVIEWEPSVAPATGVSYGPGLTAIAGDGEVAPEVEGRHVVTAPLVGTFYRAPEPGAKPFVEEGEVVESEQVIGIIEAMKIMNQIPCEVAGRVTAILVGDGEMVEFGQPLMYVDPLDDDSN